MAGRMFQAMVIGTGCAGFNAADCLYDRGVRDIALITEGVNSGTSRNTGSDKQTYYKLTLAGGEPDSVYDMARTLFEGGGVHGDTAMAEAAGSARAFMKLVNLGVPFPTDKYGAFVGYKTDHDPRRRATSCGPLTSRLMTEALEKAVRQKNIPILDNRQVIKLLVSDRRIRGLAALNIFDYSYEVYFCENIILATGGPAGAYAEVVYPASQTGGTGLALDAGADMCNLHEWQYGLASIDFRWNVSGTYQQVLPRYVSVDAQGREYEFLPPCFDSPQQALDFVFLKGYQWPFDVRKTEGSSQIDLLVAREIYELNRKVYLDFTRNPSGLENGFGSLSSEAYAYLDKSGALFGTPIERLAHMNPQAVALYIANGIDLWKDPLRVAVCAQHCNGGAAVDVNWESTVQGLYVAGEAAGTFGAYRPGGSALNAAQVGSMRAAEHIAAKMAAQDSTPVATAKESPSTGFVSFEPPDIHYRNYSNIHERLSQNRSRMSRFAAFRRNPVEMERMLHELREQRVSYFETTPINDKTELPLLYKGYDILLTQIAMLSAMLLAATQYDRQGGAWVDIMAGDRPDTPPSGYAAPQAGNQAHHNQVVVTHADESRFCPVRPLPEGDYWFETVWREYRERNAANETKTEPKACIGTNAI